MANVIVFNPKQLPAHLQGKETSALTKALAGGMGAGKRLSIKGGVFRLVVDGKEVAAVEERYLDVVVVAGAAKIGRTWYAKKYDSSADAPGQAPDCWSQDGDVPDPTSKNKQSERCDTCKQNIKGSGEGESKACRYSQRVAVVLANNMEGDVLQLSLPAQSLFGKEDGDNRPLQAYARFLAAAGADIGALITRLKFDMKSESPKLYFKAMRWLEEDEYAVCTEQGRTDDALKAITMTVAALDKPAEVSEPVVETAKLATKPAKAAEQKPAEPAGDDEPPAPAPKGKKAEAAKKPAAAAKPAATDSDDDAPAPEPALRKNGAAPAAPKGNLASVVAQWNED